MVLSTTKTLGLLLLCLFLGPEEIYASGKITVLMEKGQSRVLFEAVGRPSMLKIRGRSEKLLVGGISLADGEVSGSLSFDLDSLDTGIELRDKHMKKNYLETEKNFRDASFTFKRFKLDSSPDADKAPFEGTLTLHGVTKPITGIATASLNQNEFKFEARFELALGDYGIAIPSYSGITMAKTVAVEVFITAPTRPL